MIDSIRGLVRWERSIPTVRQTCTVSCLTAGGVMRRRASKDWLAHLVFELWQGIDEQNMPDEFVRLGITSVDALCKLIAENTSRDFELYGTVWNRNLKGDYKSIKLSLVYQYGGNNTYYDGCILTSDKGDIEAEYIHSLVIKLAKEEFWKAELYDEEYVKLQSLGRFSDYKYTKNLRRQPDNTDWVVLDNRPGRGVHLPGKTFSLYAGAAHFWFGGMTFEEYIPKERFLSFTEAEEIVEFPNGIVYINLYKDMFKGHEPEAQRRQVAFREHLGLV